MTRDAAILKMIDLFRKDRDIDEPKVMRTLEALLDKPARADDAGRTGSGSRLDSSAGKNRARLNAPQGLKEQKPLEGLAKNVFRVSTLGVEEGDGKGELPQSRTDFCAEVRGSLGGQVG